MQKIIYGAVACLLTTGTAAQSYQWPVSRHTPVVIAHRGDHTEFKDNTLTAFRKAIEIGVDYVELDVRTTKDDSLVLLHNATLTDASGVKRAVREMTYAEISKVVLRQDGPEDGRFIPSFSRVLALCHNKVNIYLDFKEADVRATWQMLKTAGMDKHTIVYANTAEQCREWHSLVPSMPLLGSVPDSITTAAALQEFCVCYPLAGVDGSAGRYSAEMRQVLAKRHVAVWLDVQQGSEGPAEWELALQDMPGGLQTDRPAALLRYLYQRSKHPMVTRVDSIINDFDHYADRILVTAHRAAHNDYPENSLPAIQRAIDAGIDIAEVDVRETKDKVLVLMHDKDINRTTNGKGLVSDYTYAELKRFRLLHHGSVTDNEIPTLDAALRMAKGRIMVDLDFKAGTASAMKETLRQVRALQMERQVLFFAYDHDDVVAARQLDFKVPVMVRVHNAAEVHKELEVGGFPVMHIDDTFYADSLMQSVRDAGVRVWSNALGDFDDAEEVKPDSGFTAMLKAQPLVNVIQTNYPEQLLAFLRRMGRHR